jgi:hypothetical protein
MPVEQGCEISSDRPSFALTETSRVPFQRQSAHLGHVNSARGARKDYKCIRTAVIPVSPQPQPSRSRTTDFQFRIAANLTTDRPLRVTSTHKPLTPGGDLTAGLIQFRT